MSLALRPVLLALALLLVPGPAAAVEATARLGVSAPQGSRAEVGPAFGLCLSVPIRGRFGVQAAGDWSTHTLAERPGARLHALTAVLGLEVSLDLAPIVPVIAVGPSFQYAWRRDVDAKADAFGGYLSVGVRATVLDHLVVGVHARYLSAAFSRDTFPAMATFALEVGWGRRAD